MKNILNFEVITPIHLDLSFPAHRIDFNLFDGQSYILSDFKRFLTHFLKKFKNKQKNNLFMKEKEKLHVLQVLDNFLCEEDKESNENDSQL